MKMFKETFKRLAPIGLPLAIATLIYTVITGGQDCFGTYTRPTATTAIGMTPVLVYYVFTAAIFAMYGFSYLFKRSASDLYHSLPVTRLDLYLSNLLATAVWMGGTILINVLVMLAMQLISGCPFVPIYVPLSILFFFVAAMLVYAATAIGCAVSGTYLTALASTGVVLFLPRFVQFILARAVVAKVPIVGWLDLGALLNPMTNVATSLAVMQSRNVFIPFVVNITYILYSLLPMALELLLGAWLFVRRPSETADRGACCKPWTVIVASGFSLVLLLLITVDSKALLSLYGAAMVAIALLVYFIYQLVASRSVKQSLCSAPWFLVAAAVAFGLSAAGGQLAQDMLSVKPAPDEIASVQFRGHDAKTGYSEFVTLLLPNVEYTSDAMKKYVSETLTGAVERIEDPESAMYNAYNQHQTIEPITLTLKNGQTVKRTIEFQDVDMLNDLRSDDPSFQTAIRSFPPMDQVQYLRVDSALTKEETNAVWQSYVTEAQTLNLITNDYYRSHDVMLDSKGFTINVGGMQSLNNINYAGYLGDQRFSDYCNLRLEMPKTAALIMRSLNAHMKADCTSRLWDSVQHMTSPLVLENDSLSMDLNFFNVPRDEGDPMQTSVNIYISGYSLQNSPNSEQYTDIAKKFADIVRRGSPTDDPAGMFLCLNWYEYDSGNRTSNPEPSVYLKFSQEDEQALINLIGEWQDVSMSGY